MNCSLCPHPAETRIPPPPPEGDIKFLEFRCGHRVHTHCAILNFYLNDVMLTRVRCPECQVLILHEDAIAWTTTLHNERRAESEIHTLWEKNEVFREEIKELANDCKQIRKYNRIYRKGLAGLKRDWNTVIAPYKNYLKNQKEIFMKRFLLIPARSKLLYYNSKIRRVRNRIRQTYSLGWHDLDLLNIVPKTPKIRIPRSLARWQISGRYIFRIRL